MSREVHTPAPSSYTDSAENERWVQGDLPEALFLDSVSRLYITLQRGSGSPPLTLHSVPHTRPPPSHRLIPQHVGSEAVCLGPCLHQSLAVHVRQEDPGQATCPSVKCVHSQ